VFPTAKLRKTTWERVQFQSAYAHALARTDRLQECIAVCEHALELSDDRLSYSRTAP
jgi:hypothetical protein